MKINKENTRSGYAILFAVVIVSVVSFLAIGLSNTTYKQLILSSVARDSSTSFFQADTGTECALYADLVLQMGVNETANPWPCGVDARGNDLLYKINKNDQGYYLNTVNDSQTIPCFEFSVEKLTPIQPNDPTVDIKSRGYNSCDKRNPRTVEREIEVTY